MAGIVRSFDYAIRSAIDVAYERGRVSESDRNAVERWRIAWSRHVRTRLLDVYEEHIGPGLVPAARDELELLLDTYALIKCLYEVRYELANRPHWVSWPLAAIAEMVGDAVTT
ncbi:MAG: hypothetical protein R2705_15030 [Ilumatobacteraceae bacterium]